jgi:DNA polymerase-3 subunit gamma/tau
MALYRDYRPSDFQQVIGQQEVVDALKASLEAGAMNHAILLSGSHGIGKTTLARLIAQSLTCQKAPTSEPCGTCPSCLAFAAGNHPDLLEMDAASNRGVDDARAIRERLTVAPMMGHGTVLIIDEAHMLTREAQNALLKSLEEPPPGVYFIFATTAPDKLLSTIRSRCSQYLLTAPDLAHLRQAVESVIEKAGIECDSEAVEALCLAAAGSYRDALTLLDQAQSGMEGAITAERIRSISGLPGLQVWKDICLAVASGDGDQAMQRIDQLTDSGFELRSALSELEDFLRLVLYAQAGSSLLNLQVGTEQQQAAREVGEALSEEALWQIIEGIEAAYQSSVYGGSVALALESRIVKASGPSRTAPSKPAEPKAQQSPEGALKPVPVQPDPEPASAPETAPAPLQEPLKTPEASPPSERPAVAPAKKDPAPSGEEEQEDSMASMLQPEEEQAAPQAAEKAAPAETLISEPLPGPAVAAVAFPLLRLAMRGAHQDQYLALRSGWARYDEGRLIVQLESKLGSEENKAAEKLLARMVNGSCRIMSRPKPKPQATKRKSEVVPSTDRGALLANMGLVPLEGERRSDQQSTSQDELGLGSDS